MTESNFNSFISQDWDDKAIDDGSFLVKQNSYRARIEDREGNVIHSEVDSISYSPEINSAPSLTVDVEPREELEGTDFLNGYLDVFVDGEILFAGEIVKISTSQREEDWFSIKAHPPARKLSGEVIDESIENVGTADFIAKTIDKFNTFDDEMHELIDTDQEVLSEGIEKINVFRRGEGTIRYNDVGLEGSEISVIYVKLFSVDDVQVTIETENESYQEIIAQPNDSPYGVWVDIEPEGLDNEEYDIEFEFTEGNSQLYDWISITEQTLKRIVEPEEVSTLSTDEFVYGADNNEDFEQFFPTPEDDDPWKIEDDRISVTNIAYLDENISTGSATYKPSDSENATAGEAVALGGESVEEGDSFATIVEFEHDIPVEQCAVDFRERFVGSSNDVLPGIEIRLGGEIVDVISDGSSLGSNEEYEWGLVGLLPDGVEYEAGPALLEAEVVETSQEHQDDYGAWEVDTMLVTDRRYSAGPTDNQLDGDAGHLDGPPLFPEDGIWIEFETQTVSENITSARLETIADAIGDGNYAAQVSFDDGNEWLPQDGSEENSDSISAESGFPTQQISARVRLASHGSREDASPKFNFQGHSLDAFSVFIDTDDFDVIDQQTVRENRLSAISSFADDSDTIFRWEGDTARIFQAGTREVDVELKKEEVTSEIDIEDTYSSVEVVGSRGITSGVIEAVDAPEYIDKHKLKLDRDITNEQDAVRRAREFLADNNQVDFSGNIQTLPTKIPVGEVIPGEVFAHGQDSIVKSGRYSKTRTDVNLGKIKDVGQKIIGLDRSTSSSERYDTSSEFTIPVGEGNI